MNLAAVSDNASIPMAMSTAQLQDNLARIVHGTRRLPGLLHGTGRFVISCAAATEINCVASRTGRHDLPVSTGRNGRSVCA